MGLILKSKPKDNNIPIILNVVSQNPEEDKKNGTYYLVSLINQFTEGVIPTITKDENNKYEWNLNFNY